jgi:hypothetical protein
MRPLLLCRTGTLDVPPKAAVKLKRHRTESAKSRLPGYRPPLRSGDTRSGYRNMEIHGKLLAVAPLKVAADCAWRPEVMEPRFAGAQWGARPNPRDGPFSIWRPPEADPKEKPQYEAAVFRRPTAGRHAGPSWVRARNRILWPDRGNSRDRF